MSRVVLTRHDGNPRDATPGTWWRDPQPDGTKGCTHICCPVCGKTATLRDGEGWTPRKDGTHGHDIADDGIVMPSVVCPHQPCQWHVWVQLVGWVP